jgi:tryptophanyl-tRNA synthetase
LFWLGYSEPMLDTNKKNAKPILLSGSAPSGDLTLGNFIGAIRNWKKLEADYDCFYMVVDLHSITTKQDPKVLRDRSLSFFAQYLACGLDPKKNTAFVQSHVAEHAELAWVLNCFTPFGDLSRMTQFKDKSQKHPKNINAGLFTYPVLMAADILLYQTNLVPVGEDQKQHLELTRDIALRFNNELGQTFTVPEPFIAPVGGRVMALQEPNRKMDKSDPNQQNTVFLLDEPKAIEKKFKSATTDSGSEIVYRDDKPGVSNLLEIYSVLSGLSIPQTEQHFQGKMYGHLKMEIGALVAHTLEPIRNRYQELMADKGELNRIISRGAEKARSRARSTLALTYDRLGFLPKA